MHRLIGLRQTREERRYSRRDLGKLLGMQSETIVQIENGSRPVEPETALAFANLLGVELHDLTAPPTDLIQEAGSEATSPLVACQDPAGRLVALTIARWVGHILPRHPELAEQQDAVLSTIEEPDEIRHDIEHRNRECYYRLGVLPDPFRRLYLKVCVEFGSEDAFGRDAIAVVVTTFPVRRPKQGEVIKWP